MTDIFDKLFSSPVVERIQARLPVLFSMVQAESMSGGRAGMEVGKLRERVLIALLMQVYGERNVEIPSATAPEGVVVCGEGVSIKTLQGDKIGRFKLSWTVDWDARKAFVADYIPTSHILFVHIAWDKDGMLYLIDRKLQKDVLGCLGRGSRGYFHVPRPGTNPKGVEISSEAIDVLANHESTRTIPIHWKKGKMDESAVFKRWLDLWRES